MLSGECVALCDLGLAQGHKPFPLPGEEEEPPHHLEESHVGGENISELKEIYTSCLLSGSPIGQLPHRVLPSGLHDLYWVGDRAGFGICL